MKFAVFWEPGETIRVFVQEWKDRVGAVDPDAPYLSHPVHSTLYLMETARVEAALVTLRHVASSLEPMVVALEQWRVFRADPATGGDTLTITLRSSGGLYDLQMAIARGLSPLRARSADKVDTWHGEPRLSVESFGFPFVGPHWIPHVTIASLRGNPQDLVAKALATHPPAIQDRLDSLSAYQVEGDNHFRIGQYCLGGPSAH